MKLRISENSLFALLLRAPFWVSCALAGALALAAQALLPPAYALAGALSGFPFLVVGAIAGWRQLRAPRPAQLVALEQALATMRWSDFAALLEAAWGRAGHCVERIGDHGSGAAADLCLTQGGRATLVSARRWKAAEHGIEPLRALHAAMLERAAPAGIYVLGQGRLSDQASAFARTHSIALLQGQALARLLLGR